MTAIWTSPRTWAVGDLTTEAMMNSHIRDNLDWLKTPTAASATWASNFTTTSASAVDITSATVTLTTNGGGVDVHILFDTSSSVGAVTASFYVVLDGVTFQRFATRTYDNGGYYYPISAVIHIPAVSISAASHTIKLQCLTSGGTLTVYGSSGGTTPRLYVVERGG